LGCPYRMRIQLKKFINNMADKIESDNMKHMVVFIAGPYLKRQREG